MQVVRRKKETGNTIVEFALVSAFLIPLLLGTVNVGMNMSRSIQVTQISRDAGHMFVRSVDFSEPGNQDILVRLAQGLNMTRTGGNGKIVLTRVMMIGEPQCTAAGLTLGDCTNYTQPVITQQLIIGNPDLRPSDFGEAPAELLDSKGEMSMDDYITDVRARATGFGGVLALQPGELAYVAETYFESPEFDFPGFFENTNVYARTIF